MCLNDAAFSAAPAAPLEASDEVVSTLAAVIRFYANPGEQDRATDVLIPPLRDFISPADKSGSCEDVKNRIEFLYLVFGELLSVGCFQPSP